MTGIQFDHAGHGTAGTAKAAREQAARVAAGPAHAAAADTGRTPYRDLRRTDAAGEVPALARAGDAPGRQESPLARQLRRGPDILFLAQRFAQEGAPEAWPAVSAALATARYPSLGFRDELILPGEAVAMAEGRSRIDIYA